MFKYVIILLAILFVLLQYQLWQDHDGIEATIHLRHDLKELKKEQDEVHKKDLALHAAPVDAGVIQGRARSDLGMVHQGETFYRVVHS